MPAIFVGNFWYAADESESESISHSVCPTFVTPWTVACQAPLSMEFSRKVYWSGLLFPTPGDLPELRIEPRSPALWADSLPSGPPGKLRQQVRGV